MRKTILSLSSVLLMLVSCNSEKAVYDGVSSKGITVKVTASSVSTKSGVVEDDVVLAEIEMEDEAGGLLTISRSEGEMPSYEFESTSDVTKGAVVTTSSLNQSGKTFSLEAFLESSGRGGNWDSAQDRDDLHYIKGAPFTCGAEGWTSEGATWRNGVKTHFWAYTPSTLASGHGSLTRTWASAKAADTELPKASISYTMASPGTDSQDATRMDDIVFAYNTGKYSGSGSADKVSLAFSHALACVYFNISGVTVPGVTVKDVSLVNVYSSASCDLTGSSSGISYAWKSQSTPQTYVQKIVASDYVDGVQQLSASSVFQVIPQTLGSGAALAITLVSADGNEKHIQKTISDTWQAGHYYAYKISYTSGIDELTISVSDSASGSGKAGDKKSNLVIKNTGNVNCYIRAAIVANWVDASGNIVAPWDSSQGTFSGLPGNGWVLGSDGFWYFTGAVAAGSATPTALFTTYTVPTVPAGADHLVMTIAAQGVRYDSSKTGVTAAWGSAAAALLNE